MAHCHVNVGHVSQGRGEQIGVFIWSAQSRMTEESFHQAVSS